MKICVLGLTHLGAVTAICTAQRHDVVAIDPDTELISRINHGELPIFEAGLDELFAKVGIGNRLRFSSDYAHCSGSELLWVCFDTPVNEKNEADAGIVVLKLNRALEHLPKGARVLLSSQLPVGTCAAMEKVYPEFTWAVSPENLQLGKAVKCFTEAERVVLGVDQHKPHLDLQELFEPYTKNIIWMKPESAEMTKHALNCFLSMSIAFSNEVGRVCEKVGADVREVEAALKSDIRIGSNARLSAGSAYEGSSLAREVNNLTRIGEEHKCNLSLIPAIHESNEKHREWSFNKVISLFQTRPQLKAAILGLTFKPGTHTLKRSGAVALAKKLHAEGFEVIAYDPSNPVLPEELKFIEMKGSVEQAVFEADVAIVGTQWPELRKANWREAIERNMRQRVIVDAGAFLTEQLKGIVVQHITVGRIPKCLR